MKRIFLLIILALMLMFVSACSDSETSSSEKALANSLKEIDKISANAALLSVDLLKIKKSNRLVVVTVNAPRIYYKWRGKMSGFEYDLINAYANKLGVKAVFVSVNSIKKALKMVETGKAHIAAAGLTLTPGRTKLLLASSSYIQVKQQLVCHKNIKNIKSVKHLVSLKKERFKVLANSSYHERLGELKQTLADLQWTESKLLRIEDLLKKVWRQEIDCTVADSNIVGVYRRYYPDLKVPFSITGMQSIVWYLPKAAVELRNDINVWLKTKRIKVALSVFHDRYYGYLGKFDYLDSRIFIERVKELLPKYKALFVDSGKKYNLDWRMIAAISYQESHWDKDARSPTGVRGLMMLTKITAKEVKVTDRLDPRQSVEGGSRYFRNLLNRLPTDISGEDKYWFALAAYNMGFAHVLDAMKLARKEGHLSHRWAFVKKVLPHLQNPRYYKRLRYGRGNGREALKYVKNIRNYYDLLVRKVSSVDDLSSRK